MTRNQSLRFFMLKQSKGLPIALGRLVIARDASPIIKKMLATNMHRVRELELSFKSCSRQEIQDRVSKILVPGAAPLLEQLELTISPSDHIPPTRIFVSKLPTNVRSLSVSGFQTDCDQRLVNENMTSLSIRMIPEPGLGPIDFRWIYRTLGTMSNLTRLHIDDPNLALLSRGQGPDPGVSLPRLEMLEYSGAAPEADFLLNSLLLPVDTSLRFCFTVDKYTPLDHIHDTAHRAVRRRAQADAAGTTYEVVGFSSASHRTGGMIHRGRVYAHSPRPSLPSTSSIPSNNGEQSTRSLTLSLEYRYSSFDHTGGDIVFPTHISRITDMLPPESIETIRIRSNMWFNVDGCYYTEEFEPDGTIKEFSDLTFLSCTGVRSLYIGDAGTAEWMAPFLSRRLGTGIDTNGGSSSNQPDIEASRPFLTFPQLENLVVSDLNPHRAISGWLHPDRVDKMMDNVTVELCGVVRDRALAGRKLKGLDIRVHEAKDLEQWVANARGMGWVEGEIIRGGESYEYDSSDFEDADADEK